MWQDWTNALLGLAVMSLVFFDLSGQTLGWTLGLLGGLIAILSFWAAGTSGQAKTA